ncbi:replication associated protein [Lynx rufus smacovirus 2]|uniref:Replication associated protein n=1 Tax=Lynx rufus smacovirus 2 TaxID=2592415 RepID=A0A513ZT28_9VIRU|nr:replication associated protein [Lynx rufus smacovirus 2]QDH43740.1 replication associated protein [Lynx rufus smacovirus 2]
MTENFMITAPRDESKGYKEWNAWIKVMYACDAKKWVIAAEVGRGGYKHWQIRVQTGMPKFFEWMKAVNPRAHVEKASDTWEYERKGGKFITSDDNKEIFRMRFGKPSEAQKRVYEAVRDTNDREIVVWYDPTGKVGKSWFIGHLWETGKAYKCQNVDGGLKNMIEDIASDFIKHGRREMVVIDIPRTMKWDDKLLVALEMLKDGLIKDSRFNSTTVNIRGTGILVCCNTEPDYKKLTSDRWVVYETFYEMGQAWTERKR